MRMALLLVGVASSAAAQPTAGSITVRYDGKQTVLTPADLASLPRHDARIVAEGASDSITVSGVFLWDVLQRAGAPSAEASGRQRAVMYVRLVGADGQGALMALVEVDPGFSRRTALVVDRRNGRPLDAVEGPWRVVVPDDARHARWIRGLITVEIATLKP